MRGSSQGELCFTPDTSPDGFLPLPPGEGTKDLAVSGEGEGWVEGSEGSSQLLGSSEGERAAGRSFFSPWKDKPCRCPSCVLVLPDRASLTLS
jgi:hypothetical protein